MPQSRARWSITAVAVLLNVLGSPMAWAQWLGAGAAEAPPLAMMEMAPGQCQGHESPSSPSPMPCCDGGGCSCAVPAMFVYLAGTAAPVPHAALIAPVDTSALPAHPFDDTLRPPIR